jgi:hypothetical protein
VIFQQQAELFDEVADWLGQAPLVIDSGRIRENPEAALRALCGALGIAFLPQMLRWPAGPKPYDGVWAPHWYNAVHRSTGFEDPEGPLPDLPANYQRLADQALAAHDRLAAHAI